MNNVEKVKLIAEAVGEWVQDEELDKPRDWWWVLHPMPAAMAYDGHLTDLGAFHALRWGLQQPTFELVLGVTSLDVTGAEEGVWPEGKPLDVDTIRDVLAEAIERNRA